MRVKGERIGRERSLTRSRGECGDLRREKTGRPGLVAGDLWRVGAGCEWSRVRVAEF